MRIVNSFFITLIFIASSVLHHADATTPKKGVPVIFRGGKLFTIYTGIGPFTPGQRARALVEKLEKITRDESISPYSIKTESTEFSTNIVIDATVLMSVTEDDAKAAGKTHEEMGEENAEKIRSAIIAQRARFDIRDFFYKNKQLIINIGITITALITLLLALFLLSRIFNKLYVKLAGLKGIFLKSLRFRSTEIISDETVTTLVISLFKGTRLAITLALLYAFVNIEFMLFPWARSPYLISIFKGFLLTVLTTVIAYGIYNIVKKALEIVRINLPKWKGVIIKPIKIKTIEILSPQYSAVRDGNQITIPEDYLSVSYEAPGFRLFPLGNLFNTDRKKKK
jgi:hypothetical protein